MSDRVLSWRADPSDVAGLMGQWLGGDSYLDESAHLRFADDDVGFKQPAVVRATALEIAGYLFAGSPIHIVTWM